MCHKHCIKPAFLVMLLVAIFLSSHGYAKNRIINGEAASVTDYPWIASLQTGCGGSLIHSEWILTAAHCFLNKQETAIDLALLNTPIQVTLNSTTLNPLESTRIVVNSQHTIIHPDYNPDVATSRNVNDHDLALLKLETPINTLSPIALINDNLTDIEAGTLVTIMGWGATKIENNESVDLSNSLLKATQKIVSSTECTNIYQSGISDNMLCAGGLTLTDTSDSCQGDSGGPLVIEKNGQFIQVGIVSFGGVNKNCGEMNIPGVYTKIARYKNFIEQNISGVNFVNINTACTGATLKSNLDLNIACLIYQDAVYSTDLYLSDENNLTWVWSGKLTPNDCTVNAAACTTLSSNLDLTIRQMAIEGVNHTGRLRYNSDTSQPFKKFWNYISHSAD